MPNLSGEKIHVLTWVWYIIEGITGIYIFSSLVTNKIIPVTLFAAQIDPGKVKWIDRGKTKTDVFYCQIYAEYLLTNIHFSILAFIYIARAGTKIFSYFIEWETQVLRNNMSIIIEVSNYKRLSFTQLTENPNYLAETGIIRWRRSHMRRLEYYMLQIIKKPVHNIVPSYNYRIIKIAVCC